MFRMLITDEEYQRISSAALAEITHKYNRGQFYKYQRWLRANWFPRASRGKGLYVYAAPVPVSFKVKGKNLRIDGFLLRSHYKIVGKTESHHYIENVTFSVTARTKLASQWLVNHGVSLAKAKETVGADYNDL
ncbi:MAG: hypothetical protein IIZ93_11880 [Acidaminococcaceae bacterium]|nr:hypothetical protein [Acidaminococcaceae bacterium]